MTDILEWVRWLFQLGMWLHPLDHPALPECAGLHRPERPCDGKRGKHPCTAWSRRATNSPPVLRGMFSGPPRNIGIACKASSLLVVDEDRHGAFTEYAASNGHTIEPTLTVVTASGRHFYFRPPAGVELGNGVGALAGHGIDIRGGRGHGGYVVGPGSLHETGVIYTPVDADAPILPAPGWLVEALQATPPRPEQPAAADKPRTGGGLPYKVLTGLVRTVLDATAPTAAAKGNRNERLFWAGCQMYKHANRGMFDAAAGRAALLEAARRVGLSDGDALSTLESAARNVGGRS